MWGREGYSREPFGTKGGLSGSDQCPTDETSVGTHKLTEVMKKPCSDLLALAPKEVCECDGTCIMEISLVHLETGDEITSCEKLCTASAELKLS